MPRPPQPVGHFDTSNNENWIATESGNATITPTLILKWSPGSDSDGASIPKLLQGPFSPRFESATFAQAFVHDMLYAARLVPRKLADYIFFRQLLAGGVHIFKARIYYAAVYTCGWYVWNRHTPGSVMAMRSVVTVERI